MHEEISPEDVQATYTIAVALVALAAGLYALKLANFRFVMGVGG